MAARTRARFQEDRDLVLAAAEIGRNKAAALHSSVIETLCLMGRKVETLEHDCRNLRGQLEEALQENEKLKRKISADDGILAKDFAEADERIRARKKQRKMDIDAQILQLQAERERLVNSK